MNCLINPVDTLTRIEYHGLPVLTTEQLAKALSSKGDRTVTVDNLKMNFRNNRDRFEEGKHFFKIEGEELDILRVKNFYPQISPKTRTLYLWTKRGVARHCKMVNTDTACSTSRKSSRTSRSRQSRITSWQSPRRNSPPTPKTPTRRGSW